MIDIAATIRAEDQAWAEMHNIDTDAEFARSLGALVTPQPENVLPAGHSQSNPGWSQFMDPYTRIVRGQE